MKVFIIKVFLVIILAFGIAEVISLGVITSLKKSNFYKPYYASNNKGNSFDYVIIGSSRGLTTINTNQIDRSLKLSGFNFSIDDSSIGTHYLMLKHLENYISFRELILVYENTIDTIKSLSGNDFRFFPYLGASYIDNYFLQYHSGVDLFIKQVLPFTYLGYYNIELFIPGIYSIYNSNYQYRSDDKGNYSYPESKGLINNWESKSMYLSCSNFYFKKIIEICRSNNIKLTVYIAPHAQFSYSFENPIIGEKIRVINHSDVIENNEYFYDIQHLNQQGRSVVTKKFINDWKMNEL